VDEEIEAYVRALKKSAEYLNKEINPIELKALIKRFQKLNPDADPRTVDWVAVWDDKLTYNELLDAFQRNYPGFRWKEAEEVSEEAFEDARKRKLEAIVRELDEESLKELLELIRQELGSEAETIETETRTPQVQETVLVREATTAPTLVQEVPTPSITLEVLAKYPVLEEAKQFFDVFTVEELDHLADAVKARLLEAVERGEKGILPREDPMEDLLTFALARVLCLAIGESWLLRRWALAEAARMERFLHVEAEELKTIVLKSVLNIEAVDDKRLSDEFSYKIHVAEYLKINRELSGPEWRLVNRMVHRGYVHLTEAEVVRLFRQKAYQWLSSAEGAPKVTIKQLPPKLQEAAEDVMKGLVRLRSAYIYETDATPATEGWPPCMEAIKTRIAEASHRELFTIAAFLVNKGYTVEQILSMLAERPDFNERIARYQVEHIAGLRGSRTKYRPPACQTMKAYGLCIEDGRLCPRWIRNPIEYRKTKESKQTMQAPP
jgi:DNA primase large subunit